MYDSKPKQLIHQLLEAIFSDEELNSFCQEYFPEVHHGFTSDMDNASKIRLLIEACDQDNQLGKLVLNIKGVQPEAYQSFVNHMETPGQSSAPAEPAKSPPAPATMTIFPKDTAASATLAKQVRGEIIPNAEALLSQSLEDRYQIKEVLDKSGLAAVFKAHDTKLEIDVAIKLIDLDRVKQSTLKERVRQEVRTSMQLDHPGIVKVYDFGQTDSLLYIIMEFIPGYNLRQARQYFKSMDSKMALPQVIQLFEQICLTVDYMHQQRVLHPGTKPENVMLKQGSPNQETAWRPVMINLGLLRPNKEMVMARAEISPRRLMFTVSPELLLGHATDIRSDVYALGILLYDLAVGQPPFRPQDIMEAVHFHVEIPPPLPRSINPDISEQLEQIILKALAKNPADRYLTAKEMAQALGECLNETRLPTSTAAQTTQVIPSKVVISMDGQSLTVEPGASISTLITLRKQGGQDERCQIMVQGVPEAWVSISPSVTTLSPGKEQEIQLSIHPPRTPESKAGPYSLTIQVVNQEARKQINEVKQALTIAPYSQFTTSLWPKDISAGQVTQVTIENQGNSTETFTVRPKPDKGLIFKPDQVQVKVAPGGSGKADFNISPRGQFWVAEAATYTFSLEINPSNGRTDTQSGQVTSRGLIAPKWVFGALMAVTLVLCAIVIVIFSVGDSLGGRENGEAAVAFQPPTPNQTATADWLLDQDPDRDGLSNREEVRFNTLPNDPDTDKDGLTDGEEVNQYGTDPNLNDTDRDGILDGDEVRNNTDPLSREGTPGGETTTPPDQILVQFSPQQDFLGDPQPGDGLRYRVNEGHGSTIIQVSLSTPATQPIEVNYGIETNAKEGVDFLFADDRKITFDLGARQENFTIEIPQNDEPFNGERRVIFQLQNPSFGAEVGANSELTLIIVDDD